MNTEGNPTSQSKCYWWKNQVRGYAGIDRYRRYGAGNWERVCTDGSVETKFYGWMEERLSEGAMIEVADEQVSWPPHWPLIDGKPINPEGFPALYKAVKKFINTTESSEIRQSDVEPLIQALALADKLK